MNVEEKKNDLLPLEISAVKVEKVPESTLILEPANSFALLHPVGDTVGRAVVMVVILLTAVVAIVVGITAMMQNNAGSQQFASREQEEVRS